MKNIVICRDGQVPSACPFTFASPLFAADPDAVLTAIRGHLALRCAARPARPATIWPRSNASA